MSFKYIDVVTDTYNRLCIVTEKAEPDQVWIDGQSKPFSDSPDFHTAYPLTGGSVIIDLNQCTKHGQMRSDAIEKIAEFANTCLENLDQCPKCGRATIWGGGVTIESGKAYQEVYCSSCDAEWMDKYTLTNTELYSS